MTGTEIITTVRSITNDTVTYNPADAEMLTYLILGMRLVRSLRADSLRDTNGDDRDETEPTALSDTLDMDKRFQGSLTDYVVMRVFQKQGADMKALERAKEHRQSFFDMIKVV
jgi:hypothetical protein